MLVPILLGYLDQTQYGIWLTMMSIISWFGFMDVGLGNGLRNKFAVAKANGNDKRAKIYVSTAYAILIIVVIVTFLLFLFVNGFISWSAILNTDKNLNSELTSLAIVIFGFFSIQFVFNLITTIIIADQKPAIVKVVNFIGKILILIGIYILTKTSTNSLIYVGFIYTGLPVLILIISSIYFYSTEYRIYAPSLGYVDFSYGKDLIGLGWKFFLIQISVAVLFTTDNIIISQLFGPEEVTPYQIAHKYFAMLLMAFSVLISPMWSAYTEAFVEKDYDWIKRVIDKQEKVWYLIIVLAVLMTIISKYVYEFWVGDQIGISYLLSASWALFIILETYSKIYTYFLNGVGKVKLQMITAVVSIFVNIPLSILFAKTMNLGIVGVILATCVSIIIDCITRKIQVAKIINGKAQGIWNQ